MRPSPPYEFEAGFQPMADATLDPLALVTCVTISTLAKNYLSKAYLKMDSVLSDWAT